MTRGGERNVRKVSDSVLLTCRRRSPRERRVPGRLFVQLPLAETQAYVFSLIPYPRACEQGL